MALVQVVRLVEKAARVEIEATAVVPRFNTALTPVEMSVQLGARPPKRIRVLRALSVNGRCAGSLGVRAAPSAPSNTPADLAYAGVRVCLAASKAASRSPSLPFAAPARATMAGTGSVSKK